MTEPVLEAISEPVLEAISEPVLEHPLSCPTCGETTKQHRAGKNATGTLRRECRHCGRTYTPAPKHHGYDLSLRRQALKLYVDGNNLRRIARHLDVNPQTVANWVDAAAANWVDAAAANWVDAAAAKLPAPPLPQERQGEPAAETLELDELFTFVTQKKRQPTLSPA